MKEPNRTEALATWLKKEEIYIFILMDFFAFCQNFVVDLDLNLVRKVSFQFNSTQLSNFKQISINFNSILKL